MRQPRLLRDFLSCSRVRVPFFRGFCVRHDRGNKKDRRKSNFINYSSADTWRGVISVCHCFPQCKFARTGPSCRSFFSFEARISRGRIFWTNPLNRSRPESHVCALWWNVRVHIHMHASASNVACVLYVCDRSWKNSLYSWRVYKILKGGKVCLLERPLVIVVYFHRLFFLVIYRWLYIRARVRTVSEHFQKSSK